MVREVPRPVAAVAVPAAPPAKAKPAKVQAPAKEPDVLALQPGDALYAQIKGVALM